jgi:peptidoglycan hydrolase CwlO-like protein
MSALVFVAVFSGRMGAKTLADYYWAGHSDIQAINSSIDTLSNRIQDKNKTIANLNNEINISEDNLDNKEKQVANLKQQLSQVETNKQLFRKRLMK